jgi:hypothetical protein
VYLLLKYASKYTPVPFSALVLIQALSTPMHMLCPWFFKAVAWPQHAFNTHSVRWSTHTAK